MLDVLIKYLDEHNITYHLECDSCIIRMENLMITCGSEYFYLNGIAEDDIEFIYYIIEKRNKTIKNINFIVHVIDLRRQYNRTVKVKIILE